MTKIAATPGKRRAKPLHPTVAAEFDVFVIRRAAGSTPEDFWWRRGEHTGDVKPSLVECEKDALRHLRALPARPVAA